MTEKKGSKHDLDKPRWDLLPFKEVEEIVKVLTHGSKKYTDDGWKFVEKGKERYFAAALRHLSTWWLGEKCDKESGFSHLAHAICCLLFLMWRNNNE